VAVVSGKAGRRGLPGGFGRRADIAASPAKIFNIFKAWPLARILQQFAGKMLTKEYEACLFPFPGKTIGGRC
jgi:hypothetical protein